MAAGFQKILVDKDVQPHLILSQHFSWITNGAASKSGTGLGQAQYLYSLSEGPTLRYLLEDKNNEGFLQKTCWYSRAQSGKCWWFNNCGPKNFSAKDVNLKTIIDMPWWYKIWQLSGYNPTREKLNLLRKRKRACKSSWSRRGNQKHSHWQFIGIRQNLWRIFLESVHVNTAHIGNKWDCWKSSAQNQGRDICSIVAIRSGWKMVGGLHGMLLLFAKHSRSFVWREENHLISVKDMSRLHQFGRKVLQVLGYALHVGVIRKGDILFADIEELEQMDASEIYAKGLNAMEVLTPMSGEKIHVPNRRWDEMRCGTICRATRQVYSKGPHQTSGLLANNSHTDMQTLRKYC